MAATTTTQSTAATTTTIALEKAKKKAVKNKNHHHYQGPGLGVQLLTAGSAACVADLITFPLDTAKVRLQVSINIVDPLKGLNIAITSAFCRLRRSYERLFHALGNTRGKHV